MIYDVEKEKFKFYKQLKIDINKLKNKYLKSYKIIK